MATRASPCTDRRLNLLAATPSTVTRAIPDDLYLQILKKDFEVGTRCAF